jgi:DNA-binding response OmpR family regulator
MPNSRLLIVEADDELAQLMSLPLTRRGFQVTVTSDVATALKLVCESLPAVILLDIDLPDLSGYELLRQLRQMPRTRHLPAIIVTQRARKPDRVASLELGADDFMLRPFDTDELSLRVQNLVAHTTRDNLVNPHTGLPGHRITLEETARARIEPDRAIVELRLLHAAEFRDFYGLLAYADLLRHIALLMGHALNESGASQDFVGQQDDEVFVIITSTERAAPLYQTIVGRFAQDAVHHYALAEPMGEQVKVKDSTGLEHIMPLVKLQATVLPS